MEETFKIVFEEKPEDKAWGVIGNGLQTFNVQQTGDEGFQRICYSLQDTSGEIVGGVIGELYWNWFHVDLLWIREDLRGRGYGKQLMEQVEAKAREAGAKHVFLDTFSFQAPELYKKLGYQVFGELPNFPGGHTRYFMQKDL